MAPFERLPTLGGERVDRETAARRLRADGLEPIAWSNGPHDRYAPHTHGYEKLIYCAAGSITLDIGDPPRAVELRAGDGLRLAPHTRHSAVVGPAGCTCVEGHRAL